MGRLQIAWTWQVKGQFHIGAGIGRVGYADSILRCDANGRIFIPGDAVKGAVREAAERLLFWLVPSRGTDIPQTSYPDPEYPILQTFFAPPPGRPFYRFSPGRIVGGPQAMRPASTAIDNATGVADDTTLRILETLPPNVSFKPSVTGEGSNWSPQGKVERMNLIFLLAAILSTEVVGGKKGIGHGEMAVKDLSCKVNNTDILGELLPGNTWNEEVILNLQQHVKTQGGDTHDNVQIND
ncbi:MAG: RAMP superfamily CRISPR-associated protein [Deltaproteobacteria bacterium]|nr:RAMP superfamily CRISPR-associated protein [Deltaproteobacteria bacterium]